MKFYLSMDPPTVTAQMHKVVVVHGKPRFYDTKALKDARARFMEALMPMRPDHPAEGPIALEVVWYFRSKSHKDLSYRVTRPDTDNLQKLLKDCMTDAGFWNDDAQVCVESVSKFWTRTNPGLQINVEAL